MWLYTLTTLIVCIQIPDARTEPVSVNVAATATVSASSTLVYGYIPENVIDGNNQTVPDACNCCWSSVNESEPYITLLLPKKQLVTSIEIIGRSDRIDAPRILTGVNIAVDGVDMTHVQHLVGNTTIRLNVTQSVSNITVIRPLQGSQTEWYLYICEIKAYSPAVSIVDEIGKTNVHLEQSSFLYNNETAFGPQNAIDGTGTVNIRSCPCCSVTNNAGQDSWWQVDLKRQYLVWVIQISGRLPARGQAYNDQLQGAVVYAGNTSLKQNQQHGVVIYTVPTMNSTVRNFTKAFDKAIISQFFLVKLNKPVLSLCEFKMFTTGCRVGFYGDRCSSRCHCKDKVGCLKNNGTCPNGCEFGWTGDSCSTDMNILAKNKHSIPVNQSSLFWNKSASFGPQNAIDGVDNYDVDHCGCCSVTADPAPGTKSWWQIDLGQQYFVHALQIFGRSDGDNEQLQGAIISAGNTSLIKDEYDRVEIYTVPNLTDTTRYFTKILDNAIIAQFFLVELSGSLLTLCEFKLFKQVCHVGMFGVGCSHVCHCYDNQTCNYVTGECQTPGCYPGWRDTACDQGCPVGFYGTGCSGRCRCKGGNDCLKINGSCPDGCEIGWEGDSCSTVCHVGMFGFGCSHVCHCSDNQTCNAVTGECQTPGCYPGWRGTACDQECVSPSFGTGCSKECHCINGTHCGHVSGHCDLKQCDPGWYGQSCDQESITLQSATSPFDNAPAIVGGLVGGVIVILIVVAAVVLCKRRAGNGTHSFNDTQTHSDTNQPTHGVNANDEGTPYSEIEPRHMNIQPHDVPMQGQSDVDVMYYNVESASVYVTLKHDNMDSSTYSPLEP